MSTINHRSYLAVALPFVIATVTQPLLGAVDTAVVGRLGHVSHIGGVTIGTVIFNTLYWLFGFLRVSTSGYSSQALGTKNPKDMIHAYVRPLVMALVISICFVLCRELILRGAIHIYHPDPEVAVHATTYFSILIWGAPLVMTNYVNLGWLMGQKKVKAVLLLQVSANVMNILLDLAFVFWFKMGVAGVAWATLISQGYGFLLGMGLMAASLGFRKILAHSAGMMDPVAMKRIIAVNSDLMVRTFCLLTMTNLFVAKGSEFGPSFLAANAVLFQIQYIIAYFYDGLANASSIFAGDSLGRQDLTAFRRTRQITDIYLGGVCLAAVAALILFKGMIIHCFTNLEEIVALCNAYMVWMILYPITIGIGLVYYGFYTGTTHTGPVKNSMLIALAVFAGAYYTLVPLFHNHGLWLAFILFCLCRSIVLFLGMKQMEERLFPRDVTAGLTQSEQCN